MANRGPSHGAFVVCDKESHQASGWRGYFSGRVVGNPVLLERDFAWAARIAPLVTKIGTPRASYVRGEQHASSLGENSRQLGVGMDMDLASVRMLSRRTDIDPIVYA